MAISDLAVVVKRVYIERDYSYPEHYTLSFKKTVLGVIANLMGEARQDGRIQLAQQLSERLNKYQTRLDLELREARAKAKGKSSLFNRDQMDTHPIDDNYGV